jgi:hypothetical protein
VRFDEQYQLAGDAVVIAPVSRQIPCKQGILQGNRQFWRVGDLTCSRKRPHCSAFRVDSLLRLTGKNFGRIGYCHNITGKLSRSFGCGHQTWLGIPKPLALSRNASINRPALVRPCSNRPPRSGRACIRLATTSEPLKTPPVKCATLRTSDNASLDHNDTILLTNLQLSALNVDDFLFV